MREKLMFRGLWHCGIRSCVWIVVLTLALAGQACVKEYQDFTDAAVGGDADGTTGQDAGADIARNEIRADLVPPDSAMDQTDRKDAADAAEPDVKDVAEPDVKDVAEPDVKDVAEPDIEDVLEPSDLSEEVDGGEVELGCIPEGEGDEFGDGIDQNCDGIDGIDDDGDGFAVNADGELAPKDCDDDDPEIKPGAEDPVEEEHIDQNCDGMDGVDSDGDGYATEAVGEKLADCEDGNSKVHPGAPDFVMGACSDTVMTASTEVVDEEGDVGYYSSAGMGDDGTLYVAYRRAEEGEDPAAVKLGVLPPGAEWNLYTVTQNSGQYIDLAVADGKIHVTYYDKGACKCLRYAHATIGDFGGGQWQEELVDDDDSSEVGRYSSVAVDKDGFVHIAYWDKQKDNLKYATNSTGQFVAEVVSGEDVVNGEEEKVGSFASLDLDSDGNVHISAYYTTGASLVYVTNDEGGWTRELVDDNGWDVGKYSALAVDGNDAVHIAYRYSSLEDLRYATNATGTWDVQTVDGAMVKVGSYGSIAIDSENKVHIAYNQGDLDYLRYATNRPGYWVATKVYTEQKCGLHNSIVLAADGTAHIFTGHNDTEKLLHSTAVLDCLEQEADDVDSNCDGSDGVDGDGDGYASIDSGGEDCDDADEAVQPHWVTSVLDPGPSVGKFASLAIDRHNILHASYYSELPKDLMYAKMEPGQEWDIEPADETGQDVGQYSSIAVEHLSAGDVAAGTAAAVHIAYYDAFHSELWYATNASGSWVPEVVEATPEPGQDVGKYASIATDGYYKKDQSPHITYHDSVNGVLRYATRESGTWELFTIPNAEDAGMHTRCAVYKEVVYVAYQAVESYDLMVATGSGDTWEVVMVDGPNKDVGDALSIAVDTSYRVHVSYRDTNERYLHYALRKGGEWSTLTVDTDAEVGKWTALALDGNKNVHVAYKDQGGDSLLYATNTVVDNYQWIKEEVTYKPKGDEGKESCGGLTTECGDYASLQFDPFGRLNVIHYDSINKQLLFSRKSCLGY